MRLLVLGGTSFVGPAVIEAALQRGCQVTCVNRGRLGAPPPGAEVLVGDRTDAQFLQQVAAQRFDWAVDTWSGAPYVARDAARALARSVGRWAYVSTRSVYDAPPHRADESARVFAADPDGPASSYPRDKRGAELAYEREVGADRVVHLRAGLILGPRENIGRLPWWLRRIAKGGPFLAPGPADLPLQYVDVRDLAAFALDCLQAQRSGPVDTVSRPGYTTTGDLLATCVAATGANATATWVDAQWLLDRSVSPWTELPVWIPPQTEDYAMHCADTSRAADWGLRCRSVTETVSDTWRWVRETDPAPRDGIGMDPARERALLAEWVADGGR